MRRPCRFCHQFEAQGRYDVCIHCERLANAWIALVVGFGLGLLVGWAVWG